MTRTPLYRLPHAACLAALAALALALAPGHVPAHAQTEAPGASYLNPFPANDVHKVQMVGDDLADGLMYGLIDAFANDSRVEIVKRNQVVGGLTRNELDDRLAGLADLVTRDAPSIAVVMLGAWDRNPIRIAATGKRANVGTPEWRAEYAARADRLIKALKKKGVAVYWVGLPNVRRPDMDEDVKMMNEIIRERVYVNGVKYIDAYSVFVNDQGSGYGPDVTGKNVLLRQGDGVYFTAAGYRKLAHFVEREVKRDLSQAKSERNLPLAGSEAEQVKINPEKAASAAATAAGAAEAQAGDAKGAPPASTPQQAPSGQSVASPQSGTGGWSSTTMPAPAQPQALAEPPPATDQKADNGRISLRMVDQSGREEEVAVDIVRPAIPASVVALVTRRESPDKPTQMGEQLVDQIVGGLTVMSSVTPSSTVTAQGGGRRLSPTQSAYYRVLMKGERLVPKRGRADDFTWPRADGSLTRAPAAGSAQAAQITPAPKDGETARQPVQR